MKNQSSQFEGLSDRAGFNATVRHIKAAVGAIDRVAGKENLADVLAELVEEKRIGKDEILPIVSMALGEKFPYRALSANLIGAAADLGLISETVAAWNGVDFVVVYHHPDLGVLVVNPKNRKHIAEIDRVNRSELLVVWAGRFTKEGEAGLLDAAAAALVELFSGKAVKPKADFLKGDCVYRQPKAEKEEKAQAAKVGRPRAAKAAPAAEKPKRGRKAGAAPEAAAAPAPTASGVPLPEHKPAVVAERALKPGIRMTPMYSVPVTNELFHNGNVEAWKRVIDSYKAKNPGLEVLVYYDHERITNLNALFKWGKVKHGSSIQFAVAGDEIKDVAKLQRYLAQGASPQFEAFLRGPVNAVLQLF